MGWRGCGAASGASSSARRATARTCSLGSSTAAAAASACTARRRRPGARSGATTAAAAARHGAVVADEVEAELCERIAKAVLPADIIELAREELRQRLALPRDDGKLRRRLEQRRERLSQLFAWGDLTEAEYRRQKAEVERDLAMLPDDDKLVLFDRHRGLMVSMAENVAAATPEQLRELILMLVERAETRDRELGPVRGRARLDPSSALWEWRPRTDSNRRRAA